MVGLISYAKIFRLVINHPIFFVHSCGTEINPKRYKILIPSLETPKSRTERRLKEGTEPFSNSQFEKRQQTADSTMETSNWKDSMTDASVISLPFSFGFFPSMFSFAGTPSSLPTIKKNTTKQLPRSSTQGNETFGFSSPRKNAMPSFETRSS
jgi:hypothetical protein